MSFLSTPEHVHLLLNHVPLIGLFAAMLPLLWGLLRSNEQMLAVGLLGVVLFGAPSWIIAESGEQAVERMEHGEAPNFVLDADSKAWLEEHEESGDRASLAINIAVVLSIAALVLRWRRSGLATGAAWLVLVAVVVAFGFGAVAAADGGRINHPEFRTGPPPAAHDDDGDEAGDRDAAGDDDDGAAASDDD